ncbi:hypothetical protein [Alicyclobacillus sp. SO9]|uniref:hypothetical protein n=1 Tax=Alicyclobacillus sp. SO9 TaxID=2665646 RepID=UPI0018E88C6B|nr:hypothetical protein [Alicyclobacillus sp. SO9]QQE80913.1 hypothetical protein GI364_11310 [Alicyclobacillus sp. SO9]
MNEKGIAVRKFENDNLWHVYQPTPASASGFRISKTGYATEEEATKAAEQEDFS